MFLTEIQNYIGHSSTEADRIRSYRNKLTTDITPCTNVVQKYDNSTPELEIELDKEIEIEKEVKKKKGVLKKPIEYDIPTLLQTTDFKKAFNEWLTYLGQKKKKPTDLTISRQLKLLETAGPTDAILMIDKSISCGWQGLFPLKGDKPAKVITSEHTDWMK